MPRSKANKRKAYEERRLNVMRPAPMLRKQVVTLKDVYEVSANGNIGNGFATFAVSPNGFRLASTQPWLASQEEIWNQYASMFENYQVSRVTARFIPYKWEFKSTTNAVNARPVFSIVDPETTNAMVTTVPGMYSYGNCHATAPYAEHHRSMNQFMDLAVQKQDRSLIKFTNASWAAREQYGNVASMGFLVQAPTFVAGDPIGIVEYSISYIFSGQHAPSVSVPRPLPNSQGALSVAPQVPKQVSSEPKPGLVEALRELGYGPQDGQ